MKKPSEHEDNRAAWDLTAALYEQQEQADIAFLRDGGNSLLPPEQEVLGDLTPWCQRAVHLQCAAGVDTLSLLRQGAHEVVGIDISERMIASARRKSTLLHLKAAWYCCDVLDTPTALDATADLVHTGRGALLWMMDLDAWATVIFRLLKPGGLLHIFEGHPLDWVWDNQAGDYQFHPQRGDYFAPGPYEGDIWPRPFIARLPGLVPEDVKLYDRAWTLGDIINSIIRAGLRLTYFNEYPLLYWDQFPQIPAEQLRRLPHSFSLLARK